MEAEITDVKTMKTGTDYVVLRIPKRILKTMPDGYFYMDVVIKSIRGGKKK